jgi:hypothetical protein
VKTVLSRVYPRDAPEIVYWIGHSFLEIVKLGSLISTGIKSTRLKVLLVGAE